MSKIMPLEVLSSIKGAKSSGAVDELFRVIKKATSISNGNNILNINESSAILLDDLRNDEVINSTDKEKDIIKNNFPKEKNGYLVVSKVIED